MRKEERQGQGSSVDPSMMETTDPLLCRKSATERATPRPKWSLNRTLPVKFFALIQQVESNFTKGHMNPLEEQKVHRQCSS